MKSGGVAGIILPVSVLNRNGIHAHAREIILKCFDIVALAEFGSGTFGQTGTNTVTMFLRRKETNTPDAEHYQNRVNSWFAQRDEANAVYQDEHLLELYCNHCGYQLEDYKTFVGGKIDDGFLNTETVQAYYASFFGNQRNAMKDVCDEAKTIRNKYLSRANTRRYKQLPLVEQNQIKEKAFLNFVTAIEKEKVYYFVLAHAVSQPVLLIKSPTSTSDVKKFLGYGWSDSKGNEGIQYLNIGKAKSSDDEDGEDDDTMSQIRGIDGVQTPLFNPANLFDDDKINTLIRKNFMGEEVVIPKNLETYVTKGRLVDMLDFTRAAFTKEFKTSLRKKQIEYRWNSSLMEDILLPIKGSISKIANEQLLEEGQWPVLTQETDKIISGYTNQDNPITDVPLILFGDHSCTLKYVDFPFFRGADGTQLIKTSEEKGCLNKYLYYFLSSIEIENSGKYERHFKYVKKLRVPLPPMDVQKKIVEECEKIDKAVAEDSEQIRNIEVTISKMMLEVEGDAQKIQKLCSAINPSKSDVNSLEKSMLVSFVEMSSVSNDGYIEQTVDKPLADVRKSSYTYFAEGDIIIAKITPCMENGKCALATGLKNGIGFGSSEFHVFRANAKLINNVYLFAFLNRKEIRSKAAEVMTGSSGHRRVPISFYEDLEIPVPSMDKQMLIAEKYKGLMKDIESLKQQIANASSRKQAILDKYLK